MDYIYTQAYIYIYIYKWIVFIFVCGKDWQKGMERNLTILIFLMVDFVYIYLVDYGWS